MNAISLCAPALEISHGHPTASSIQVAEFFGKQHRNVVRDIEKLIEKCPKLDVLNFEQISVPDKYGRQQKAYRMDRKGFVLLAMGFTGTEALKFKIAYIDAFDAMEAQLRGAAVPALPSPTITPEQQKVIKHEVAKVAGHQPDSYRAVYGTIKMRYDITRYDQLAQEDFDDCIELIRSIDLTRHVQPYDANRELRSMKAVAKFREWESDWNEHHEKKCNLVKQTIKAYTDVKKLQMVAVKALNNVNVAMAELNSCIEHVQLLEATTPDLDHYWKNI